MKCPTCDSEMKPLLMSSYCPRDCDRPKNEAKPHPVQLDFGWDDEPTQPYIKIASVDSCPKCGDKDIEEFDPGQTEHCWACGHFWFKRHRP